VKVDERRYEAFFCHEPGIPTLSGSATGSVGSSSFQSGRIDVPAG